MVRSAAPLKDTPSKLFSVTCGMIFRRVEEVLHADSKGSHPDPASGSKKRPLPSPNDEDRQVSAFKRVRLVTNKREHSERAATPEREEEVSDRIRHSNGNANDILSPKVSRIRSSKRSSAYKVSYSRSQCPPDYWECPNCGASNSGITADFCPVCDYRAG